MVHKSAIKSGHSARWMLDYYRPYLKPLAGLLVSGLIAAVIVLPVPLLIRTILDEAIPNGDTQLRLRLVVGCVAFQLLGAAAQVGERVLATTLSSRIRVDVQRFLYEHLRRVGRIFRASYSLRRRQEELPRVLQEEPKGSLLTQCSGTEDFRRQYALSTIGKTESANRDVLLNGSSCGDRPAAV